MVIRFHPVHLNVPLTTNLMMKKGKALRWGWVFRFPLNLKLAQSLNEMKQNNKWTWANFIGKVRPTDRQILLWKGTARLKTWKNLVRLSSRFLPQQSTRRKFASFSSSLREDIWYFTFWFTHSWWYFSRIRQLRPAIGFLVYLVISTVLHQRVKFNFLLISNSVESEIRWLG